ncbi:DUF4304 domain-containing protein [Sphingomonas sp. 35-24ZXX]|uniref:DUF4304 domain-containing protein n=1 Tax=Sphingomonas sp. 35-24ZXX TaxID=1545915 RepID=UPI0009DE6C9C
MSLRALGDAFASQLQQSELKAQGFTKRNRVFRRERVGYVEAIDIQGSSWNSGVEPWHFYIYVHVHLPDVALSNLSAITRYHASGRIDGLVTNAPGGFELTAANFDQLVSDVGALVNEASQKIPQLIPAVRIRACEGLSSPLPVPDNWTR